MQDVLESGKGILLAQSTGTYYQMKDDPRPDAKKLFERRIGKCKP